MSLFAHWLPPFFHYSFSNFWWTFILAAPFPAILLSPFFHILVDFSSCRPSFQILVDLSARYLSSDNPFLLFRQLFRSPPVTVTFPATHCPWVSPSTRRTLPANLLHFPASYRYCSGGRCLFSSCFSVTSLASLAIYDDFVSALLIILGLHGSFEASKSFGFKKIGTCFEFS